MEPQQRQKTFRVLQQRQKTFRVLQHPKRMHQFSVVLGLDSAVFQQAEGLVELIVVEEHRFHAQSFQVLHGPKNQNGPLKRWIPTSRDPIKGLGVPHAAEDQPL